MTSTEKLLLHICCYPCLDSGLADGQLKGADFDGFFYNPNIQPSREYSMREKEVRARVPAGTKIEYGPYDFTVFLKKVLGAPDRCFACYTMRMEALVSSAAAGGYRSVSSTLFFSPHQKTEMLEDVLSGLCRAKGLELFPLKPAAGYGAEMRKLKSDGVYVQNYCGCIFSEYERFYRK